MARNFLLTREDKKNNIDMNTRFKNLDVNFISIPLIEIIYDFKWSFEKLEELEKFTWVFFTSQGAVNAFFLTLEKYAKDNPKIENRIYEILMMKKFAVVGEFTGKALGIFGFKPEFMPSKASSKNLIEEWKRKFQTKDKILWVVGDNKIIEFSNEEIVYWKMYNNQCPIGNLDKLKKYMSKNIITDYFVSSPSIWSRFFYILKEFPNYPSIHYYVIGNTTYKAIKKDIGKDANVEIL